MTRQESGHKILRMTLGQALISVWQQAIAEEKPVVELDGERYHVTISAAKKLRTVRFACASLRIDGIEQNPRTSSRWAKLASQGKRIMQ
ncbi:MAG: hypothetical protein ACRD2O_01540, partial [Terriglobia bacterium]